MTVAPELDQIRNAAAASCAKALDAVLSKDVPAGTQEAFKAYARSINDVLAAADSVTDSYAQLDRERPLSEPSAWYADKRQVKTEADAAKRKAIQAAQTAHSLMLDGIAVAAVPKLSADREALARQELQVALTSPQDTLLGNVRRVASQNGEAAAVLHSPYGKTLLGTLADDNEVSEALTTARSIALSNAKQQGTALGKAADAIEAAGGAIGAADTYYGFVASDDRDPVLFGDGQ